MKSKVLAALFICTLLVGCETPAKVEKSWEAKDIQGKDLKGVLVVAMATSEEGRRAYESDFTAALKARGINAVAGYTLRGGTDLEKEDVVAMAGEAGVDTALITLFAGRDHDEVLHAGRKYYAYAPVYGRDYYGRGRVYAVPYQVGQTSDFWAQHNSIHLEASLYEVATEELLWRASSGMEEQDDVKTMRKAFIESFMQDLADRGLVN